MKKNDPFVHKTWYPFIQGVVHPVTVAVIVVVLAILVIAYADEIDKGATYLLRLFFNL